MYPPWVSHSSTHRVYRHRTDRMHRHKLEWFAGVVWLAQHWLSPDGKAKNSICSVHEAATSAVQRILESCCPSVCVGIPEKQVLTLAKVCLSHGIDELSSKCEGKQAKSKSFLRLCPFVCPASRRYDPDVG